MDYSKKQLLMKTLEEVKKAGKLITDKFNSEDKYEISEKGFANFVTEVDYAVQNFLIERLSKLAAESSILAEECEESKIQRDGRVWILDPIDGTTNFVHKHPNISISLAFIDKKEIVFGIVYNPVTKEMFYAIKGEGAYLNDKKIMVSAKTELQEALIGFGLPYDRSKTDTIFKCAKRIFTECHDLRRSGSAALDLCFTACGRIDGYFELDLKPWDILAGKIILEEAGGRITNWKSEELNLFKESYNILATNGLIHEEMFETILNTF